MMKKPGIGDLAGQVIGSWYQLQDPRVQLSGHDFNFGSREDRKIKKSL